MVTKRVTFETYKPIKKLKKQKARRRVSPRERKQISELNKYIDQYNAAIEQGKQKEADRYYSQIKSMAKKQIEQEKARDPKVAARYEQLERNIAERKAKAERERREAQEMIKRKRREAAAKAAGELPEIDPSKIVKVKEPKKPEVVQMAVMPMTPKPDVEKFKKYYFPTEEERKRRQEQLKEFTEEKVKPILFPDEPKTYVPSTMAPFLKFPEVTYTPEQQEQMKKDIEFVKELGKRIRETYAPALTLDEIIYLPEKKDLEKYQELRKGSNPLKGGLRGGELGGFLREKRKELEQDIKKYNQSLVELDKQKNNPTFQKLQKAIGIYEERLEELSKKAEPTQTDVNEFNEIKTKYDRDIKRYNFLYQKYADKYRKARDIEIRIKGGYRGPGLEVLKEATEDFQKRTGKDLTLARSLLKAGVEAYKIEEKVLGAQLAGTVIATTPAGAHLLSGLSKPLSALGSKWVTVPAGSGLGAFAAGKEYQRTGDLPYSVAAGLGTTAGFFGSIYSKGIVEAGIKGVKGIKELPAEIRKAPETLKKNFKAFKEKFGKLRLDTKAETYSQTVQTDSQYVEVDGKFVKRSDVERYSLAEIRAKLRGVSTQKKLDTINKMYNNLPKGKSPESVFARKRFFKGMEKAFGKKLVRYFKSTLRPEEIYLIGAEPTPAQVSESRYAGTGLYEQMQAQSPALTLGKTTTQAPTTADLIKDLSVTSTLFFTPEQIAQHIKTQEIRLDPKLKQREFSLLALGEGTATDTGFEYISGLDTGTGQRAGTIFKTPTPPTPPLEPTLPPPEIIQPIRPPRRPPKRPRPPKPPTIKIPGLPKTPKGKMKTYQGYHAEYIPEGGREFERLNKKQQTIGSALSTMARKVDKFRTTVGRIVQGKKITQRVRKKSPIVDTKDPYWKSNKHKFRKYGLKNGKKVPLPKNTFVEKKKYRQDKPLERLPRKKTPFGF